MTPLEKYGGYGLGIVIGILLLICNRPLGEAFVAGIMGISFACVHARDLADEIAERRLATG
jgi:hypothetical protein